MNKILPARDLPEIFHSEDIHLKIFSARYSHLIRSFNHPLRQRGGISDDPKFLISQLFSRFSICFPNLARHHSLVLIRIPRLLNFVAFEFIERIECLCMRCICFAIARAAKILCGNCRNSLARHGILVSIIVRLGDEL